MSRKSRRKGRLLRKKLEQNYGLLASNPKDSKVWERRCSLVGDYMSFWEKNLDLDQHPDKDGLNWRMVGTEVANKELECTKKFLSNGTNNCQAWSYREWIIQTFDKSLWQSELQYCHEILDEDIFDVSVWKQMCRATRQLNHKMGEESRFEEAVYAKKAIMAHPGNEGPWTYLKVLHEQHKDTLYTNPDLECIFVDILAEAADRAELAMELDPNYNAAYSSVANRGCVHALNLLVDLMVDGYAMNNRRLVKAVNVLCAYPPLFCSRFSLDRIRHFGILWKVCSAMFKVDAYRVRYFHKFCGFHWSNSISLFSKRGLKFETEAMDDTLCDDDDDGEDLSTQFVDLFTEPVFKKHPNWKDRLSQSYMKKRRRPDHVKVDLKWDIRRCVVKDKGTEAVTQEELQYTEGLIKVNAYDQHAWLHRQWVFQTFGGDWDDDKEFEFCGSILEKDAYNSFAWDQRFFLVARKMKQIVVFGFVYGYALDKEVLQQEADYATRKFILVEPGNPFPWAHIFGVYNACCGQLSENDEVRDAIERVLGNNNDGHLMDNAGGIINALNMLLDLVLYYKYDVCKDEKLTNIMNKLCPDSCFENEYECNTYWKIVFTLTRMVEALPNFDLSWKNAADQLVIGSF